MSQRKAPPKPDLSDWIEIMRAGTHKDSKGNVVTFSQADLDQIIANHALGAAPAVLGHPKDNDPAYAWTAELRRDGDSLFTKFEDINPAFADGVATGAYRNRSVSVFKDSARGWRLRHVGWLGAAPPAMDGLSTRREFAALPDGVELLEFAAPDLRGLAWALESVGGLFRGVREWLIADRGLEAANNIVPEYRISEVQAAAEQLRSAEQDPAPTFSGDPGMTLTQADIDRARQEGEQAGRQAAQAEFSTQVDAANSRAAQIESERRAERIRTQIDAWKKDGRVLPAEESGLAEFMTALDAGTVAEFSFSASDGKEAKKTPATWFAEFMASRKPVIRLRERTDNLPDGEKDITALAHQYAAEQEAKGITVSPTEAVAHVSKQAGL